MGNAADVAACIVELDTEYLSAQLHGCTSAFSNFFGCIEQNSTCAAGLYTPGSTCSTPVSAYNGCTSGATMPMGPTPAVDPPVVTLCDQIAGCVQLSQLDSLQCRIATQGELDYAAAYGCQAAATAFINCASAGTCANGVYEYPPSCDQHSVAFNDCILAASDLQ